MKCVKFVGAVGTLIGVLVFPAQTIAAQWVLNIAVTKAVVGNSGGEYVQIITSDTIANPAACPSADSYIVRDPALVRSALAIGLTAITAGRQIQIFVTDICDAATGRPLAISIGLT